MPPYLGNPTQRVSSPWHYGRLVSISRPCPGVSLPRFLQHARGLPRCLWESPQDGFAIAGAGATLNIVAWGAERFQLVRQSAAAIFADACIVAGAEPLSAPLLLGGFAFRADAVPDLVWSDFAPAHLILPHYQLVQRGPQTWLTLNAHIAADANPTARLDELHRVLQRKIAHLQAAEARPAPRPQPGQITYPMSFAAWERTIEQARHHIRAGQVQKIVLARIAELNAPTPIDSDAVLASLAQNYPTTYRFLFEPRPFRAFLGATPELLAQVDGADCATVALAGSTRRGATLAEDADLIRQLLASAKDRHEHQLVVDALQTRLAPLTATLDVAPTEVVTLRNIHHLCTPVRGRLHQPGGILPLVEALHPTPAMAGTPREVAMELIGQLEPFPRGWYAAPVGWINHQMDGQFGVAIRSAVVQQRQMWLYAGAGIVAESCPRREWDETALKFQPLLSTLCVSSAQAH